MRNSKLFAWVVAFSALLVSGSAAYYSVYGISKMFAGAATNVMIMAASLEFSKLVIASLLYSYWKELNKILRTYLSIACCILVLITSAGIYGFLSAAYQETSNKVESIDKQTGNLEKQKAMINSEIKRYENQITQKDSRISSLNDLKGKQQATMDNLISKNQSTKGIRSQMQSLDVEILKLDTEVKSINDSLNSKNEKLKSLDLQTLGLQTNQDIAKEIGPLKYIARLTGRTLDQVVNYFIIALMLVFDPLAISLVLSSNFLFMTLNGKRTADTQEPREDLIEEKTEDIKNEDEEKIEDSVDPLEEKLVVLDEYIITEENTEENKINKEDKVHPNGVYIDPTRLK